MARPSTSPSWAASGTKTDPGGSKRALGWVLNDVPPSSWVNFMWGLFGDWLIQLALELDSLNDIYTGDKTYTGHNTLNGETDFGGAVDMHAGLDVETGDTRIQDGDLIVSGTSKSISVTGGGFVTAVSHVANTGGFNYSPAAARTMPVPRQPPPPGTFISDTTGNLVISDASNSRRDFPLRVHPGMTNVVVKASVKAGTTTPGSIQIVPVTHDFTTDGAANVVGTLITQAMLPAAATHTYSLSLGTPSANTEYTFRWTSGDPSDELLAVRIEFDETQIRHSM